MKVVRRQRKEGVSSFYGRSRLVYVILCMGLWINLNHNDVNHQKKGQGYQVEGFIFSTNTHQNLHTRLSRPIFALQHGLDLRPVKGMRSSCRYSSPLYSNTNSNDEDDAEVQIIDPSHFNPRKKSIYVDAPTNVETLNYKDTQFIAFNMDKEDLGQDVFEDIRLPNCAEHAIFTRSSYLDPEAPVKVFWDYGIVKDDLQGNRGNLYGMTTLDGIAKYVENSMCTFSPEFSRFRLNFC